MYVRWKTRMKTRHRRPTGEHTLNAVLVESVRVNGKPRQRFICHIASIGEKRTGAYWHRFDFWARAGDVLDLLQLTDEARQTIEAQLTARVPYPTEEDRDRAHEQLEKITERFT